MKHVCLILFLTLTALGKARSQAVEFSDSTILFIGSQLHYGKILAHSKSIAALTDDNVSGLQTEISRTRYTQAAWDACNCFSQNGISLGYFDFGNTPELGRSFSFAVFAEPQLSYGKINIALRGGAGISYLTRVYHPAKNPRNLFFSSPWSGLLLVQLTGRYRLGDHWLIRAGGTYHHISNGGKRQPNLGMNFPTLTMGVEYTSGFHRLQRRVKSEVTDRSMQYYAVLSYNTRSVDESDFSATDRKMVVGLLSGFYKPVARMHGVGLGLEFFHDTALREKSRLSGAPYDHHILSTLIRHHLFFGRFDFSQSLGIYLLKDYPTPDKVFQRYEVQYRLFGKFQIGLSLKAHLYVAEQMDLRLGFVF